MGVGKNSRTVHVSGCISYTHHHLSGFWSPLSPFRTSAPQGNGFQSNPTQHDGRKLFSTLPRAVYAARAPNAPDCTPHIALNAPTSVCELQNTYSTQTVMEKKTQYVMM